LLVGVALACSFKLNLRLLLKVLCSAWKDDGTTVFSGGCDKQVKMWPLLSGGQPTTVAMHDGPIKDIAWIPEMNLLATGSWDKTVKYAYSFFLFSYCVKSLGLFCINNWILLFRKLFYALFSVC
jgi:WD40 repeat protein